MKSLLSNLKDSLPYIILIGIYFIFINISERRITKGSTNREINEFNIDIMKDNTDILVNEIKIKIPVIPYQE